MATKTPTAQTAQTWKYLKIYIDWLDFESRANQLGLEGWEIITIIKESSAGYLVFLKQPIL